MKKKTRRLLLAFRSVHVPGPVVLPWLPCCYWGMFCEQIDAERFYVDRVAGLLWEPLR